MDSRPSPDPLTAVRELRSLDQAVRRARTSTARANAMFRLGTYYYEHGTLLLYNSALWQGARATGFGMWWNDSVVRKREKSTVREYMYSHETYARTITVCLDAYDRYPSAPTAPQALYRAACAARKLASLNSWWRDEDRHNNHWRQATRLMNLLARRYPHHPLAAEARKYAKVFDEERKGSW